MVDYTISIKRPFSDFKKLAIGILLSIIPMVNLIAVGYQLNCAKTAMNRKFELPEWTGYTDLFVRGLLAGIISLIYLAIPLGIIFVTGATLALSVLGILSGTATSASLGTLLASAGIGLFAGLFLLLVAMYIVPSAIMNYAQQEKFGAAFSFGKIFGKAFSISYLAAWFFSIVYSIVLAVILAWIPYIGPAIAMFIGGVTTYTILGQVYSESK